MRLLIIGAGGHGRVVASAADAAGIDIFAFVDSNPPDESINDIPVYNSLEKALAGNDFEEPHFIIAIGDNTIRAAEYSHAIAAGLTPASVIHPTAIVSESAYIAPGSFIAAQVVVNSDASVGENVIVNTAAIVEHDCVIGSHAFIAPAAVLCGNVRVGAHSFVSANATLIPNVKVGEHVLIAAGAVVTKGYPDEVRLTGIPARSTPLPANESVTGLIPDIS
ncbi:MAG: acetyltransferase [Coriobacteriia bacterium]|nr:acetyltransferase [Coriobacteriia bacterium]MCL2746049.1 acetyltransferase [Coriobacteriia bacterium]MCL2870041.1 acetyltransferase [Coriobacteriia bacterium]